MKQIMLFSVKAATRKIGVERLSRILENHYWNGFCSKYIGGDDADHLLT